MLYPLGFALGRMWGVGGVELGFGLALIGGEVVALTGASSLRRRAGEASHTRYAFARVLRARNLHEAEKRLAEALTALGWHVRVRLGDPDHEIFLLRPIREDPRLPEAERPETLSQVCRALGFDFLDRIANDAPPWPNIQSSVKRVLDALVGEGNLQALRTVVFDEFRQTSPWYRARSIRSSPGILDQHPLLRDVLIYVLGPVTAAIAFAIFAPRP